MGVAELDVSEVFNPEDLRRNPEPETPESSGSATEERTEKMKPVYSWKDTFIWI